MPHEQLEVVNYLAQFCAEVRVSSLQAEQLMKRIGVEGVKLTDYEMNIASHLVDPQTMKVRVVILRGMALRSSSDMTF